VFAQPDQFQYQHQPYTALSYVFFLEATTILNNVNIQELLSKRSDSDWECNTEWKYKPDTFPNCERKFWAVYYTQLSLNL